MKFKNYFFVFILAFFCATLLNAQENDRIQQLKTKLESLVVDSPGLNETTNNNFTNAELPSFLRAMANAHKINLIVDPSLNKYTISYNFTDAKVIDILLYVCRQFNLTIDFTGNILSVKEFLKPIVQKPHRIIPIQYENDKLDIELNKDTLSVAFRQIMDKTGKNLVYQQGMEDLLLNGYIKNIPFDAALDKIAYSNGLSMRKTRDGFYEFEKLEPIAQTTPLRDAQNQTRRNNAVQQNPRPQRARRGNFYFQVNKTNPPTINVDFQNTPIETIINDIGLELNKSMFTASPLSAAGDYTAKADTISFDLLLTKVLENTGFRFKKMDSIYYFGKREQTSVKDATVIPLMHRSIEIMTANNGLGRRAGRTLSGGFDTNPFGNFNNLSNRNLDNSQFSRSRTTNPRQGATISRSDSNGSANSILDIIPEQIKDSLNIGVDLEMNSFIVTGASQDIKRFKDFINYIDKPVPVILIEVMLLEVNKTALVETGIEWGIGDQQVETQGNIYPNTDITLGSNTVNRIIGGSTFGSWNLGQVVPNFFAKIKAMETNGDIKVRSAPRLSALNGHRANLSIGETTYYAITQNNIIGSQNPQTTTITNYVPIDAEFALNIKPLVSGDGQITLDINVIQSTFNGKRIADDAPPGINSREFNSIIRVQDQDLVILGGLEEKIKNDSGSGVPFLARVPIIKWFFSKKKREDTKKKLTVFIKPTIIN